MRGMREKSAVLLDRHPLWLDALDKLVAEQGIEVVGRATGGDEAIAMIEEHRPDIFIAGVDARRGDDNACLRKASETHPGMKSVVVADDAEPEAIAAAFEAGASVYCVKAAEQEDLASAIRQAFERSIYIASGPVLKSVARPTTAEAESAARELTRRELEILRLVAEGHSNSQLARMLWVTEQTVKFHLSNIYRKLDVANRTEAGRWAQRNGLLSDERHEAVAVAAA
jgi:two-component system, NarL family, response regulator LiaR